MPDMKKAIIWIIIVLAIVAGVILIAKKTSKPGAYDELAACIADSGATFYGAFWCPHCQSQKAMFGRKSAKLLPYVECSTPDGKGQKQACTDAGIEGYPTWAFADGSRLTGEIDLDVLAEKTSCPLPSQS